MPNDTTTHQDEAAELREEWDALFQRLRAIDPKLASAVDENCGARASLDVRPLVEALRSIVTVVDTVPAAEALPAIRALAEPLVEYHDPSY